MELPPELTRIPIGSLDVLRYMGSAGITSGDSDTLAAGTGMSSRAIGRAIRGLVTKGYLNMDDRYVYFLTEKGAQAVQDVLAYDEANPHEAVSGDQSQVVMQYLVAVLPRPIGGRETSTLQVGMNSELDTEHELQIVLRISAIGGSISPGEITLDVRPGEEVSPAEAYLTPTGMRDMVRVRIEALQMVNITDVHQAGGMYFDVPVAPERGALNAWYGTVSLQA